MVLEDESVTVIADESFIIIGFLFIYDVGEFTYYGMNNKHFASCRESEAINYYFIFFSLTQKGSKI